MITLAWYLLKVIICTGILCGYYYLALRNKVFNRWNRFFLLGSVVLALLAPIININIFWNAAQDKGTVIRMLQTINSGDEIIIAYSRHSGLQFTTENKIIAVYFFITLLFFIILSLSFYKIYRLQQKYPVVKMKQVNFIATDAKGTPFSFFKSIFWNNAIDLHSLQGQQIFNHEIAHVKEKHSYDKLFMNVVLLFFWMNPFFWLMRKELYMIHEFIADKEALEDNDLNAFAEMVLATVYPGKNFSITNNFFHSPLKRRLMMFSKNKHPKVSYLSRLLVLPLAAIVFFAFTLKMKTIDPLNFYKGKKITVVIDAGHGGSDNGAVENNINEKDLNLAIAKNIQEMNKNQNINILLSRDKDIDFGLRNRTEFTNEKKADLFISIHVDAEQNKNENSGLSVFIPKNDNPYLKQSQLLGSALVQSLENNYQLPVITTLQQRDKNFWVLMANQCPSVLIETGFMTTPKDLDYLSNPENQKKIATEILNGIEKYAEQNLLNNAGDISTTEDPARTSASKVFARLEGNAVVTDNQSNLTGRADTALIEYLENKTSAVDLHLEAKAIKSNPAAGQKRPLYLLNGKAISEEEMKSISPGSIKIVNIFKGDDPISKYGEKAKNGVVQITATGDNSNIENSNNTEGSSSPMPGNAVYILNGKIVSKEVATDRNPNTIATVNVFKGETAINKHGDKGKNGVVEIITRTGEVSQKDSVPGEPFTKVEYEASFPGGPTAWTKYIISKIQDSIKTFTDKDYGTCLVKFIVNTDGTVSQVEATTMKDSHLAKISVEAVKAGPKWIPASQHGDIVSSYRLQPVTLTNTDKK